MVTVGLVVEGRTDRVAAERVLAVAGVAVDLDRVAVMGGKQRFDKRIAAFNDAAAHMPWFALRDLDNDADGCTVHLRKGLLRSPTNPGLCLRIVARTLEAWLLADAEAVSSFFRVPLSKVPRKPEELDRPKDALVALCRSSRRKDVREGMVPPRNLVGPGPLYPEFVSTFCREAWRPEVAAENAPTLARALAEIRAKIASGAW